MKTFKWLFLLCSMFLILSCGGNDDVNENAGDPRDTPGQNDNSDSDADNDGVYDSDDLCPDTPAGEAADADGCSDSQKDSDNDGVSDDEDECDETPDGDEVNEEGCADSQKDTDGDGVTDDIDQCADTPQGEEVDEYGCSGSQTDGDGDGVPNEDDECPNTPEGEEVDENGCADSQKDSDGDGVNDDEDECPETPDGEDVDDDGCSDSQKDTDNDGVNDDEDECPDTPEGEEVNDEGCSESQKDSDNDGVNDDTDECPDTPEGEEVNETGCSDSQKDTDGDGVSDDEDECPDTPEGEEVDENGCSAAQSDTTPPQVTSIDITETTETYFKVDWRIDEGSKGYIRFGTSPGNYQDSTAIEHRYLDRHRQTVGGDNPSPLTPNTTYYWQIYLEDEYGNKGYWDEQTTTTIALADDDNDGVPNDQDVCPDTPEGSTVNDQGCHTPDIGEFYEGGFVFYIFEPGDYGYVEGEIHGLVMAPNDVGRSYWAKNEQVAVQVFDDWFGYDDGMQNTEQIMAVLQDNDNAAGLCYNLVLNGYDDWYLPSVFEGLRLCENLSWPRLMNQELHPDISVSNLPGDIDWLSNDSEPSTMRDDYTLYQATAMYYDTCIINEDPEYGKTESSFGVRPIRRF